MGVCSFVGLVVVDEPVGRTIMGRNGGFIRQFRKDGLGQLLAELNSPLVETVNVPDSTLHKDLHFVNGNETAEGTRGELLKHERVGWTVSFKHLVWDEGSLVFLGHARLVEFSLDCFGSLSESHGLGLGEKVTQKNRVVVDGSTKLSRNIILCLAGSQKVARNDLGSLVNQLVESVLTVGSRFSPNDGTSLDIDGLAVAINVLSVGFHVSLLEVGGESVHVLIVRKNGHRFGVEKVVVPDSKHGQSQRQVFLSVVLEKVLIDGVGSCVHFHPIVESNGKRNGGTNGTPQGVTSSDPVPESEHVGGVNSKFGNTGSVGGEGGKMLGDGRHVTVKGVEDPLLGDKRQRTGR